MVNNVPASVHSGREVIYNLFYRTYIDSPREDLYTMLEELLPSLAELSDGEARMLEGVGRLQNFVNERAAQGENLAEFDLDTLRNYTRILCLTDSVPTAESYYVSPEKLVMQEARDEVLKYYSDWGMKKSATYNEYEDFISNEMHFMSYLAQLTGAALDNGDDAKAEELLRAQYNFLTEHPQRWLGEFSDRINAFKEAGRIHGPMAVVMSEFIKVDLAFLEELVG